MPGFAKEVVRIYTYILLRIKVVEPIPAIPALNAIEGQYVKCLNFIKTTICNKEHEDIILENIRFIYHKNFQGTLAHNYVEIHSN